MFSINFLAYITRVGFANPKNPSTSVINPGVNNKAPDTARIKPSAISPVGNSPDCNFGVRATAFQDLAHATGPHRLVQLEELELWWQGHQSGSLR